MKCEKHYFTVILFFALISVLPSILYGQVDPSMVPPYVSNGLAEYGSKGYKAAVGAWLAGSPYKNAVTMASNMAFFKNIEKLAGKYISYDILMTRQTVSSNVTYVRMNYERLPGYVLFTSFMRKGKWVLGKIDLDRSQRFGALSQ